MAIAILTRQARAPRRAGLRLILGPATIIVGASLAVVFVAYVLWPRWPEAPVALDAPALPIVVAGETFNVPPAALRMAVQRHPGPQERIDLAYAWPALTPPEPAGNAAPAASAGAAVPPAPTDRLFVTVASNAGTVPPTERLKIIYPRYTATQAQVGPDGLTAFVFREGTPYQGEDLIYDHTAPERFLVRCTRDSDLTPGACLYERFVGAASITIRFPREWLPEWRTLAQDFERLVRQWRNAG